MRYTNPLSFLLTSYLYIIIRIICLGKTSRIVTNFIMDINVRNNFALQLGCRAPCCALKPRLHVARTSNWLPGNKLPSTSCKRVFSSSVLPLTNLR